MTLPTIQVLVGFQTTTGFGNPFQLDDPTYGKLDTGTLGGLAFADLTDLVQTINIRRGKTRQLDNFNAGVASVQFYNATRILDPLNTASPYYPYVLPRAPIIIRANSQTIFTGVVTDWNLDYDITDNDVMTAECADVFAIMANQELNEWTPSPQLTGARIDSILDRPEILFQGGRNISSGISTVGGYLIPAQTNVLQYLQQVTTSEQGYLFISADGALTFKDRFDVLNPVADAVFDDTGTAIPYQTLSNEFGDELLFNYIVTESVEYGPFTASDAVSQALYQSQQYSLTNLLNNSLTETQQIGQYLLGRYKDPVLRFTGLTVQMRALTGPQRSAVLSMDLTDIATVTKTYGVGTPTSITQNLIVSGINHSITPNNHTVSFMFESTDGNQYLTLNDAIFGVLDQNLLAF